LVFMVLSLLCEVMGVSPPWMGGLTRVMVLSASPVHGRAS